MAKESYILYKLVRSNTHRDACRSSSKFWVWRSSSSRSWRLSSCRGSGWKIWRNHCTIHTPIIHYDWLQHWQWLTQSMQEDHLNSLALLRGSLNTDLTVSVFRTVKLNVYYSSNSTVMHQCCI